MKEPPDSLASLLGDTAWDYSPEDAGVGLLSPMSWYFRGFPWEGWRAKEDRAAASTEEDDLLPVDDGDEP